jgi:hypothetical protein
MKKAWLRFAGEVEAPQVRVLRREGPLVEVETAWFPMQLRSQLDRHKARRAEILTFGRFTIDAGRVRTPHPDLFTDEALRRALTRLDPETGKWLQRFHELRRTASRPL